MKQKSTDKLSKYKKICKISFIIELILFLYVVGIHGTIEKRKMGSDFKEHQMTVVEVDKSVSTSYDSRHKMHPNYKVKFAVMINGEKTWFYSNNSRKDYTMLDKGSTVKIYEYKGQYSTKRDTFTVRGVYRVLLIIDVVAVMFSILAAVMIKIYDMDRQRYRNWKNQ